MTIISKRNKAMHISHGNFFRISGFMVACVFLTACSQKQSGMPYTPFPLPTIQQSETPLGTNTPLPTITPMPTETKQLTATQTQTPTLTATPTEAAISPNILAFEQKMAGMFPENTHSDGTFASIDYEKILTQGKAITQIKLPDGFVDYFGLHLLGRSAAFQPWADPRYLTLARIHDSLLPNPSTNKYKNIRDFADETRNVLEKGPMPLSYCDADGACIEGTFDRIELKVVSKRTFTDTVLPSLTQEGIPMIHMNQKKFPFQIMGQINQMK